MFGLAAVTLIMLAIIPIAVVGYKQIKIVAEDHVAITVNRTGFIKRILPPGGHLLYPFETIAFTVETRVKLMTEQTVAIATSDGVPLTFSWSGLYTLNPALITEQSSQRLRNLPFAERMIARQVDIGLRHLVGEHTITDLFKPALRRQMERRLSQLVADLLKPHGVMLISLSLQALSLPPDVAEALNKAKAIEALDRAIRQLDPTTREVVRGAYQLDEILHWDAYLPVPSRLAMKRAQSTVPQL